MRIGAFPAHLTAIVEGADVVRITVRQLLTVTAAEAQRQVVNAGVTVQPRGRIEAVVGKRLPGRHAQQLEEVHLHHLHLNAAHARVRELGGEKKRSTFSG